MTDPIESREAGLRRLPRAYSLALRLRDAGVADDVMCEYLDVEPEALDNLMRLAEMKLAAAVGPPGAGVPPLSPHTEIE